MTVWASMLLILACIETFYILMAYAATFSAVGTIPIITVQTGRVRVLVANVSLYPLTLVARQWRSVLYMMNWLKGWICEQTVTVHAFLPPSEKWSVALWWYTRMVTATQEKSRSSRGPWSVSSIKSHKRQKILHSNSNPLCGFSFNWHSHLPHSLNTNIHHSVVNVHM